MERQTRTVLLTSLATAWLFAPVYGQGLETRRKDYLNAGDKGVRLGRHEGAIPMYSTALKAAETLDPEHERAALTLTKIGVVVAALFETAISRSLERGSGLESADCQIRSGTDPTQPRSS